MSIRVPTGEPYGVGVPPPVEPMPPHPNTVEEEAWELVKEWYAARNEPVPEQDRQDCMRAIEESKIATGHRAPAPPKRSVAPKATQAPKTPKAPATARPSGSQARDSSA